MSGVAEVSSTYLAEMASNSIPVGYKQTEVGVIPENWEATTVGQVTSMLSGGTPNRKREDYWQGDIPWISGSTLKTLELETSDQFLTSEGVEAGSKMAPLDATLLLVRGSALHSEIRAGLVVAPLCFNQDVKALIPNKSIVPRYLTIYLLAMESELLKLVSSAGNSAGVLDTELVKNFKFLRPPKHEQTAIANALSDVDALISELEKLIAKKQAIKTATMQQLLTGRTRLPQFALREDGAPKGTKPSELGEIPVDWEAVALKDLLKESPKYGINAPAVPLEGKLPVYIRITDISEDGYFKPTEKVGVKSPFSDLYQLADGDLVLARTGASVGKSYLYRPEDGVLVYAGFLIKVTPEQSKLDPKFLFQYLQTERYWSWVTVNSMRSGQPGINGNEYGSLMLPWPKKDEQTAIATILSDMDAEIHALEQRLGKTRQIKQGMMQELLTGKTRLVQPVNKESQYG
ncbi:restriction endonuclease subunit S [Vibrio cholerae]